MTAMTPNQRVFSALDLKAPDKLPLRFYYSPDDLRALVEREYHCEAISLAAGE